MEGQSMTHHRHSIMDTIEASIMGWDDHKPPLLTKQPRALDDDGGMGVVLEVEGRRRVDHRAAVLAACRGGWVGVTLITERTAAGCGHVHRVLASLLADGAVERRRPPSLTKRGQHGPQEGGYSMEHEYRATGGTSGAKYKPSAREALMACLTSDWQPSSDLLTKARVQRSTLAQTLRQLSAEGLVETRTLKGTHYKEARATPRLLVWRMSR